jgi:hypothetical protein
MRYCYKINNPSSSLNFICDFVQSLGLKEEIIDPFILLGTLYDYNGNTSLLYLRIQC